MEIAFLNQTKNYFFDAVNASLIFTSLLMIQSCGFSGPL